MTQTMSAPTTLAQDAMQPKYVISDDDKARVKDIALAWQAYDGLLDPPLQKMPDGTDPNVMTNRMQPVVDDGASFLFGEEVEISVEKNAPAKAQEVLDQVWGRKEKRIPLLLDLFMNGALSGRAFLRIVPNTNGTKFRLVVIDPATVYVETAPQDCETVLLYCIQYSAVEKQADGKPATVYYREEIQRIDPDGNAKKMMPDDDDTWQIQHWTRIGDRAAWEPAGPPIMWRYTFPPLFSCKNLPRPNSFWGKPDITPDLIGVNKALNLLQSCMNLIAILYGQPLLYASGMGETGMMQSKPGFIAKLPLPESKIVAVTLVTDLANMLKFAADLRSDIDEQSSVPGVATGRISSMPRGNLSGIAIELLFMSLLKKTTKKQCLFGDLIISVSQALLVLSGMSEKIDITLAWKSPIPHDDLPAVQAAIAKKEVGISDTTIQRELGYDPEEEAALSQTEDAQKLLAYSQGQGLPSATLPPGIPGSPALPGQMYPPQAPAQAAQGGKA